MKEAIRESIARGTKNYPFQLLNFKALDTPITVMYHWHPEVEISYVRRGGFTVTINGKDFDAYDGDIFFCSPNTLHSITGGKGVLKEYDTIVFSLSAIDFSEKNDLREKIISPLLENKIALPEVISKSHEHWDKIAPIVNMIIKANRENAGTYSRMETLLNILKLLVLFYDKKLFKIPDSAGFDNKRILLATSFIEENYSHNISLSDLASLCNISENYFCSFFKQHTKKTPTQYINCVRINSACDKLLETHDSITSIALECGFENIGYFIRRFTKQTGFSPSEWRKRNKV